MMRAFFSLYNIRKGYVSKEFKSKNSNMHLKHFTINI